MAARGGPPGLEDPNHPYHHAPRGVWLAGSGKQRVTPTAKREAGRAKLAAAIAQKNRETGSSLAEDGDF
jgi:hypothetical protein